MQKNYSILDFDAVYVPFKAFNLRTDCKNIGYLIHGGSWHWVDAESAEKIIPGFRIVERTDGSKYFHFDSGLIRTYAKLYTKGNMNLFTKACHLMKEGENVDRLIYLGRNTTFESHPRAEGIDRVVTKIGKPLIERCSGNFQKKTFDFITVECNLVTLYDGDRNMFIREHISDINKKVINKLEHCSAYKHYGVPVSFLKASSIRICGNFLVYKFELKKAG